MSRAALPQSLPLPDRFSSGSKQNPEVAQAQAQAQALCGTR